ncbi:hypothetical protein [Actinoplanes sp. GCM10030250]|uniref:hypothetical protein n=1 Tax=Actinoplanes sp. GCM10030250 TaxID=3273376 RepID=UPI00360CEB71
MLYKLPGRLSRPRVVHRRSVSIIRTPARAGRARRVQIWSQVSQSIAAVIALILAIPGVLFAMKTYRDQQKLNRDQLVINRMVVDRYERRYASRVSFWDSGPYLDKPDAYFHVTLVTIRNMAPSPITDVVMAGAPSIRGDLPAPVDGRAAYQPLVHLKTIAPCQEVEVWVEKGDLYHAWTDLLGRPVAMSDVPTWTSARMYFIVAGTDWEATDRSLTPVSARVGDVAEARMGREIAFRSTPIEDCGEGG